MMIITYHYLLITKSRFGRRRSIFAFLQPPTLPQCLSDNPLKLPVGAAKLIGCPFLEGIHRCSIYTQDKAFG